MRLVFLTTIVILTACSSGQQNADGNSFEKAEVKNQQQVSPQTLEMTDLRGDPISLDEYRGQAVFLNLWATWCKPCLMEMPAIEAAYNELKDEGFVFLAASYEEPEKIAAFADKQDYTFPFVHLATDMQELGVQSIPTTYIYNQDGEVVARIIGTREWDDEAVLAKLRQWKSGEPMAAD
jgi:thiol-disulfide isomerase/thioredoxin